jgi:hypothetical protein
MSVVLLALLFVVVVFLAGSLVRMYVKDKPFYGAVGLFVLVGPGTLLAFTYLAIKG